MFALFILAHLLHSLLYTIWPPLFPLFILVCCILRYIRFGQGKDLKICISGEFPAGNNDTGSRDS